MRGKGIATPVQGSISGITPAYAGKRRSWRFAGIVLWDHPRVCGEKSDIGMLLSDTAGSPPRMRGKD